jgi:hypothetical protein
MFTQKQYIKQLICYPITDTDRTRVFQEAEAPRISIHSTDEGGKAVSCTHRPSLFQQTNLALISVRGCVDGRAIVRPEKQVNIIFEYQHR